MKTVPPLVLGLGLMVLGAGLLVNRRGVAQDPWTFSMAGRDRAVVLALQGTRRSIYVRTERLSLVPVANELAQGLQRGVSVTVDLPLEAGWDRETSQVCRVLMGLGAVVTFREGATVTCRGAYLEMDGERFIYSATGLVPCPRCRAASYVLGPLCEMGQQGAVMSKVKGGNLHSNL